MPEELHQPATEDGPDWAADDRHTSGREPRPLFAKGMAALAAVRRKHWHVFDIIARRPLETVA